MNGALARMVSTMSQPAFDFGDEPLDDAANPTFTVGELAEAFNGALRRTFSDGVWVRGEIQGWNERGGHAYFTLADDTPGRQAVLRVQFFANARPRLRPLLAKHRLRLADGMKVRIFGHLDFYAPSGQLGLKMSDLDPRFTLGDLAQQRDQVLRRLAADGLARRQQPPPLSPVPLRVGVVSSAGTAAWHDFHDELARSGFGFHLVARPTPAVQGPERGAPGVAGPSVLLSAHAVRRGLDVIVVIRGGGARNELATFDAETIARAIAAAPVPVLTGLGHEIDRSVADEVAHTSLKTPTACAAALVAGGRRLPRRRPSSATPSVVAAARGRLAAPTATSPTAPTASPGARMPPSSGPTSGSAPASHRTTGRQPAPGARWRAAVRARPPHGSRRGCRSCWPPRSATSPRSRHASRALDPVNVLARGWSITRRADGHVVRAPGRCRRGRHPDDRAGRRHAAQPRRARRDGRRDDRVTRSRRGRRRARRATPRRSTSSTASCASSRAATSTSTASPTASPGPPS